MVKFVAGGKAVHAREFGMGGNVYNINSDLGGGTLTGMVLKSDLGQLGGSKDRSRLASILILPIPMRQGTTIFRVFLKETIWFATAQSDILRRILVISQ